MASSHETRSNSPLPFGPVRRSGVFTRNGEYTRSVYSWTLPQMTARVNGCPGFPVTSTMRPSSTVTMRLHAEGQSWGHTEIIAACIVAPR